ncbi:hypothetical protein SRHO_G00102010 [Serrasalmus rhombeus]
MIAPCSEVSPPSSGTAAEALRPNFGASDLILPLLLPFGGNEARAMREYFTKRRQELQTPAGEAVEGRGDDDLEQ